MRVIFIATEISVFQYSKDEGDLHCHRDLRFQYFKDEGVLHCHRDLRFQCIKDEGFSIATEI